ncbi:hypothetical protein [Frigoriglobus tundricola]|uniref:hypothetical protein n=1 Tax=Frigoriglobus tundricola TaxID=2774151 RepID=UPI00148EBA25|nr:hypothetical protein [Frigoriglobus tundricola]
MTLLIFAAAFVIFGVLMFVSGNPAAALRGTGMLLQYVGLTMFVATVLSGLVSKLRGNKAEPNEEDEGDDRNKRRRSRGRKEQDDEDDDRNTGRRSRGRK